LIAFAINQWMRTDSLGLNPKSNPAPLSRPPHLAWGKNLSVQQGVPACPIRTPTNIERATEMHSRADATAPQIAPRDSTESRSDTEHDARAAPTCGAEDCDICSGRAWEQLCGHETEETTRLIKNSNARLANAMLDRHAFGMCHLTEGEKKGKAVSVHMLQCGDPLFLFLCDDGSAFYTHEVEPIFAEN
jgi:hypothetical protein